MPYVGEDATLAFWFHDASGAGVAVHDGTTHATVDVLNPDGTANATGANLTATSVTGLYTYTISSAANAGTYLGVGFAGITTNSPVFTQTPSSVEVFTAPLTAAAIASAVWTAGSRSLTTFGTLTSDTATAVWAAGSRTLTSFGTLTADTATAVWGAASRTLTSYGTLTADTATAVWSATTRTLSDYSGAATAVWAAGSRTLTSYGTLVADTATAVWASGSRTLTSYGTLTADTAAAVWGAASRTLSDYSGAASAVWAAGARTLTSFGTLASDTATAAAAQVASLFAFDGSGNVAANVQAYGIGLDPATSVWGATVRTLSSFGTLVNDTKTAVAALFAFDGGGNVKSAPQTGVTVAGYAANQDPAHLVLDTPMSGHTTSATVGANIAAAANGGGGGGGGGSFLGAVPVTFVIQDSADQPVANAPFRVPSAGSDVAGADGQKTVGVNAGTWTVYVSPMNGVLFAPVDFTVSTDPITVTVTGSAIATAEPGAPADTCTVALPLSIWEGDEEMVVQIASLPFHRAAGWDTKKPFVAKVDKTTGVLQVTGVPDDCQVKITCAAANLINTLFTIPDGAGVFIPTTPDAS